MGTVGEERLIGRSRHVHDQQRDDWVAATIAIRGAARTGSFSIAAVISSGAKTGNFKADAVVRKTQTGSFGVAAVIKRTWGGARYSDLILAHKPIGYWRLGESSGSPQDSSGRGNHMTTVNGTPEYAQPSLITGDANKSVGLVASSSESFNSGGSWDFDLGDVGSIEAWVKLAATGGGEQIIFSRQSGYAIGISAITTDRIFFAKAGYAILCESTSHSILSDITSLPPRTGPQARSTLTVRTVIMPQTDRNFNINIVIIYMVTCTKWLDHNRAYLSTS